eukprot:TRINITY_DN422_c0_g1_i6.p3 TRINITY_DN422_c0_g1~~TRINITY_DN422_c0_g1_i6.p3  ORF type:complete len:78 (+),score=13.29 TRINITY_DN422_c0_g1_i6:143-376(+)
MTKALRPRIQEFADPKQYKKFVENNIFRVLRILGTDEDAESKQREIARIRAPDGFIGEEAASSIVHRLYALRTQQSD